jgi:hypothetical protein
MFRTTRLATAVVLALAVAVFPAVLDGCAASCAEHRDLVASTPACHHVTSGASRIGSMPSPCGHDHRGTTMIAAKSSSSMGRSNGSVVALAALPGPFMSDSAQRRLLDHSPPGVSLTLDARSLPLRV